VKQIMWVYYFVVGDPYLLWGSLVLLALALVLKGPLGALDGVLVLLGVLAVLTVSLVRRPE
jgi:hypothetical protein